MPAPDRRLVRVDFVIPGTRCPSCNHELIVGHIVREMDTELAYGRVCVSTLFDDTEAVRRMKATVPNLTRRAARTEGGQPFSASRGDEDHSRDSAVRASRHAAEYLWLRLHTLVRLYPKQRSALSWPPLEECFDRLKAHGRLSDSDIERVLRIEDKAPPRLKLENLLDVNAAASQLRRRLYSSVLSQRGREFHESLFNQLGRTLQLSLAQLSRAELDLQDSAFAWARQE